MNTWKHLNSIEELTYPLDGAASVVKMVAEQLQDNDHSSALWLAADVVNQQANAISGQVSFAMQENKMLLERLAKLELAVARVKKGKK